ncbi:helix-turn-helix domain-containing protein [Dehalobacter sp. DCM]|uniref:helix-turn-helix domain-containing protein n=1 Tax=Dehalobacter sp. DCM TaxID=2907827 RepID=UPI003081350F|nr:helix-turn-helix domain-containing protein [Dehalobacter sp. DCM]
MKVGKLISNIRKERHLSITNLSEMINVSISYISQIEHDFISPSLSTLEKISRALDVPINIFFHEQDPVHSFVKSNEVKAINHMGCVYQQLTDSPNQEIDSLIISGDLVTMSPVLHEGVKLLYMLEGETLWFVASDEYRLKEGDSLYFDASTPHGCRHQFTPSAKVVVISAVMKKKPDSPICNP